MRVSEVPDPRIEEPTDAIIKITSTGLCGSDLHLYETLAPFMEEGEIVGHEPMGIVKEVGADVTKLKGDRVVIPFNVCCGSCWMCDLNLYSQCETTQNHEANVRAWTDELLPMLLDDDPFGVDAFATHHLALADAPKAYEHFQKKKEGMVKMVFRPELSSPQL